MLCCNELENPIGIETLHRKKSMTNMSMLQRTWKPDRDWSYILPSIFIWFRGRCNELENPIGIETCSRGQLREPLPKLQRTWKPDRDWNCFDTYMSATSSMCCNELENPIGIETPFVGVDLRHASPSCNELENPIGIETGAASAWCSMDTDVATNLKTR